MEEQPDLQGSKHIQDTFAAVALPEQASPSDNSTSRPVPTLRFPRPQGSQVLASWISSSSHDIMASPPSPISSFSSQEDLLDSPFEIISRDGSDTGSTDGRAASMYDGLSSEDERYPHPDEVRAFGGLDDMCNSTTSVATDSSEAATDTDEEDEQEEDATHTGLSNSAHQDTDVHDDFLQDHLGESSVATIFAPTSSTIQPISSIEFSEPEDTDVHIDKISVKHTIKEFSDEEAARFFDLHSLPPGPKHVSATIRQTMSQRCLSTHEPFRALYIGNDKYKGDIILKLSRAITCSSSVDYNENKTLRRNTEGVYNIVSASSANVKDNDVELTEASGFQIKVDTCIGAGRKALESRSFEGDIVYTLTVDGGNGGKRYTSIPAPGLHGARVYPAWTIPHVAVFCVSEDDEADSEMGDRQRTVWEFCERHAIPTLFISDHPVYTASPAAATRWINCANQHAVNICLESRDGDLQLRCPIDLESFLNIDNRQMNQNLAYLTGLQEPDSVADEKMKDVVSLDGSEQDLPSLHVNKEPKLARLFQFLDLDDVEWSLRNFSAQSMRFKMRCVLTPLVILMYAYVLVGNSLELIHRHAGQTPAPSILTTPPSVDTVTIAYTTTKTVVIEPADTPSFGGLLSDIAHTVGADWPKNTACSAEIYSDNEVLIKVPSATKKKWTGPIDVDVLRGETRIPSYGRLTSEGIIVKMLVARAYGILSVSVVTARKPKFNETFVVDFGEEAPSALAEVWDMTEGAVHGLVEALSIPVNGVVKMAHLIEHKFAVAVPSTEKVVQQTSQAWWNDILLLKQAARNSSLLLMDGVDGAYHKTKDWVLFTDAATFVNRVQRGLKDVLHDAQLTLGEHERHVAEARKSGEMAILKAQITSKLWWLKFQGKHEAYQEYERQARDFVLTQHNEKFGKTTHDASAKDKGTGKWKV